MSYIPTLIICKKDLDENSFFIEEKLKEAQEKNKKGTRKWYTRVQALTELKEYLEREGIQFRDELLVIAQPDLSFLNEAVRDLLDEFEIYYTTRS